MHPNGFSLGLVPLALLTSVGLAAVLPNTDTTPAKAGLLQKRETCGPGIGSCGAGICCSQYNWCGTTAEHCGAGCQSQYGTCGTG